MAYYIFPDPGNKETRDPNDAPFFEEFPNENLQSDGENIIFHIRDVEKLIENLRLMADARRKRINYYALTVKKTPIVKDGKKMDQYYIAGVERKSPKNKDYYQDKVLDSYADYNRKSTYKKRGIQNMIALACPSERDYEGIGLNAKMKVSLPPKDSDDTGGGGYS